MKTNSISRLSVEEMGGPAAGVYFVPHSQYAAQMMFNLGIGIDQYFPLDHGHTAPYLASLMAQEFVLGLKCGSAPLQGLVVNVTSRIESPLLGTCLPVNATLPI
jgi:rhamnogalacturonan acetylesterase